MEKSLIEQMIAVFKIIATIGFIAFGTMIVGITYRLYAKYYPPAVISKKWIFVVSTIFIVIVLFYIYIVLF